MGEVEKLFNIEYLVMYPIAAIKALICFEVLLIRFFLLSSVLRLCLMSPNFNNFFYQLKFGHNFAFCYSAVQISSDSSEVFAFFVIFR